jgi:hypothetical protein
MVNGGLCLVKATTFGGIPQSDVKAYRMLPGLCHGRAISICYCEIPILPILPRKIQISTIKKIRFLVDILNNVIDDKA